jgi:hypothetical protein
MVFVLFNLLRPSYFLQALAAGINPLEVAANMSVHRQKRKNQEREIQEGRRKLAQWPEIDLVQWTTDPNRPIDTFGRQAPRSGLSEL